MKQLALPHSSSSNCRKESGGKRKREEKATIKPRKQRKQYSAEDKAAYEIKWKLKGKEKALPQRQEG